GAGLDQITLALWRGTTGKDTNSISADPLYTSSTNLLPVSGSPLTQAGVSGTGITTDILGNARGNPPTIAAYEIAPPAVTHTPSPTPTATNTPCPFGNYASTQTTGAI